jgi:hypothetical protein
MKVTAATPAERAAVAAAMDNFRNEWGYDRRVTLEYLLRRWETFVSEVQHGCSLTLHDYTLELELRESLEELKRRLPENVRDQVDAVLRTADERFKFVTRQTEIPLLPVDPPAHFWWFRLPNVLHGDLLEGALAENLI